MKILVFGKDPNPYQELLYRPMRAEGHKVRYLDEATDSHSLNLLIWPLIMLVRRLQGYRILHLHWTFRFSLPWAGRIGRVLMQLYFMVWILWTKMLGYKLVWTAHNALPHTKRFASDVAARRFLIRFANSIIIHSEAAREQMKVQGFSIAKTHVVPHGHYQSVYTKVSTQKARTQLGLPAEVFVVLFFGRIEAYKNVPVLVKECAKLRKKYPHLYLVIAGRCQDSGLKAELQADLTALGAHAQLDEKFISANEVGTFFGAATVAAFPFETITSSGTVLAALSAEVPVVAPRLGALEDIPEEVGFWYSPGSSQGLGAALEKAMAEGALLARKKAIKKYITTLSWDQIARCTLELYRRTLHS